jgi:uncharacterized membrane protein YphA (DoxX/SURF4 family)
LTNQQLTEKDKQIMDVVAWILQVILALMFGMAGIMKSTQPKEKLAPNLPWVEDFSATQVKIIGVLEVLAAIGLIVPAVTKILPQLTGWAGVGLALTMVGAIIVHYRRGENSAIIMNVVLLLASAFVAYLRLIAVPIV